MVLGLRLSGSLAARVTVGTRALSSGGSKRHQLTSKAIGTTANGDYNWSAFALLQHHEMLRRELGRGTKAIQHFNLGARPWHAFCFSNWFENFMVPVMTEHHDVEDTVFRAGYRAAQVQFPNDFEDDHKGLTKLVEEVNKTAKRLDEFAKIPTQEGMKSMYDEENALKVQYKKLVEFIHAHTAEEENFYLPVMDKLGETFYHDVQKRVGSYTLKNFEKSFPLSTVSMFTCMGCTIRESRVKEEDDKGWAGKALRDKVFDHLLPNIRDGLLPQWNKSYTMYRLMIDGIVDEDNIAEIQMKIEQLMGRPEP